VHLSGARGVATLSVLLSAPVPGPPFGSPCANVSEAKQFKDILYLMSCQLLQHLLIAHSLCESDNGRSGGNAWDGVSCLRKTLDEGSQQLPRTFLHGMEVDLDAGLRVGTLKVCHELAAMFST
jgi:hypothetical protein